MSLNRAGKESWFPAAIGDPSGIRKCGDEVTAQIALQRHMLQTGLVDHEIGRLMRRLQEIDVFDSAVIVTTQIMESVKFGDQRRTLTDTSRADILSIPLFIKQRNQNSGRISDRQPWVCN